MGESFTIQISSNLVKQLADDGEKSKKRIRKPKTKIPRDTQQFQTKLHQQQIHDDSEMLKGIASAGWPLQPPLFLPVPTSQQAANAEVVAIWSILKESEKVVETLQKQEVTQRAKDLHDKEFKLPYQKPIHCLAEKDACLECYKEHVKDPLKCAHLVKNFAVCARRIRQQMNSAAN